MKQARMIGNFVEKKAESAGLGISDLSTALNCTEQKTKSFLKGRAVLSFNQILSLSKLLGTSVNDILAGDEATYNSTVVHCMNDFENTDDREMILDIIDEYMDIRDSVLAIK